MRYAIISIILLLSVGCQPVAPPVSLLVHPEWKRKIEKRSEEVVLGRMPYPSHAEISGPMNVTAMWFPELKKSMFFVNGRAVYQNVNGLARTAFFSINWDCHENLTGKDGDYQIDPSVGDVEFSDEFLNPSGQVPSP